MEKLKSSSSLSVSPPSQKEKSYFLLGMTTQNLHEVFLKLFRQNTHPSVYLSCRSLESIKSLILYQLGLIFHRKFVERKSRTFRSFPINSDAGNVCTVT